jgi:hypothetical protein
VLERRITAQPPDAPPSRIRANSNSTSGEVGSSPSATTTLLKIAAGSTTTSAVTVPRHSA